MGFDMKYDPRYTNLLERGSRFGNFLLVSRAPSPGKTEVIVKNLNGKNGVKIIPKNDLKKSHAASSERA